MKNIQQSELPPCLSAENIAHYLGISRSSAYNLCHTNGFPCIRIQKRIVVPRDLFLSWIEKQLEKT